LIFIYLSFALYKHCGEMLQAQVQALEATIAAQKEEERLRLEAMEAQRVAELQRQQQQMAEFLQYMQAVGKKTGVDVPASLLAMPPPPPTPLVHATPVSMSMII
jgi:seryl-tRNA(Sec) selenium transferase